MSQISPPIRIVLVAALGLIAAWTFVLRPKAEEVPAPAPAPATATGLSSAAGQAKDAAGAQAERAAKVDKATGGQAGAAAQAEPATGSGAQTALVSGRVLPLEPLTAEQTKGLPGKVVKALERRHVLAVGVFNTRDKRWAQMAADDQLVRRALLNANRYGGKVTVASVSLGELSRYDAIVGDLNVNQTPSVVVVDRNRKAAVLTGFVDGTAINQAIADARRNSIERRIKDPYVRELNTTCANFFLRLDRFNAPSTRAGVKPALRRFERLMASYRNAFGSLKAPARYRGIERQVSDVLRKGERYSAALRSGSRSRMDAAYAAVIASDAGLERKLAAAGATSCVANRRS